MIVTIEIDDSAIPKATGKNAGKEVLKFIMGDLPSLVKCCDSVRIVGNFGIYTEDRTL